MITMAHRIIMSLYLGGPSSVWATLSFRLWSSLWAIVAMDDQYHRGTGFRISRFLPVGHLFILYSGLYSVFSILQVGNR